MFKSALLKKVFTPRTYKGLPVVVSPECPGIFGDYWFGAWSNDGKIYLETMYVEALEKHNRKDLLKRTLEHEAYEYQTALRLSKEKGGTPEDQGGLAHELTCKHEGNTERENDRLLEKELSELGL